MWKNFRYSILVIFIIAAIVTPTTDILNMCMFAAPMIALYALSIGVAWLVHPKQRQRARKGEARVMRKWKTLRWVLLACAIGGDRVRSRQGERAEASFRAHASAAATDRALPTLNFPPDIGPLRHSMATAPCST